MDPHQLLALQKQQQLQQQQLLELQAAAAANNPYLAQQLQQQQQQLQQQRLYLEARLRGFNNTGVVGGGGGGGQAGGQAGTSLSNASMTTTSGAAFNTGPGNPLAGLNFPQQQQQQHQVVNQAALFGGAANPLAQYQQQQQQLQELYLRREIAAAAAAAQRANYTNAGGMVPPEPGVQQGLVSQQQQQPPTTTAAATSLELQGGNSTTGSQVTNSLEDMAPVLAATAPIPQGPAAQAPLTEFASLPFNQGGGDEASAQPAAAAATALLPTSPKQKKSNKATGTPKNAAASPAKKKVVKKKQPSVKEPKPRKKDTKWLAALEQLKEYKKVNGDCIVPRGYALNPRLASWVAEQRKQYKLFQDGKRSSITPERIELLTQLDFAWNAQLAAWDRRLKELQEYKSQHGHCHVPLNHTDPKLGLWVKEQRRHYALLRQGKPSHMTEERAAALDAIGFCWDTNEATWLERLRELKGYREEFGHCLVPTYWDDNPKLSTWVHHQRRQYKKYMEGQPCHITKERIELLNGVGISWPIVHKKRKNNRNRKRSDSESDDSSDSDDDNDNDSVCTRSTQGSVNSNVVDV